MDKENVIHINNGMLLAIKKKGILSFVPTLVNLHDITLNPISQSPKDKHQRISLMHGIKGIDFIEFALEWWLSGVGVVGW